MDGLHVEGITKSYGSTTVVDNVSFQAPQGKILGLLGPNGAGKTTILRMIMASPPLTAAGWSSNRVVTKLKGSPSPP